MRLVVLGTEARAMDATCVANALLDRYQGVRYTKAFSRIDQLVAEIRAEPDLIVVTGGYEQRYNIEGLLESEIPVALIPFKEYRTPIRKKSVVWAFEHGAKIFTWNPHHEDWTNDHQILFNYLPFGADPAIHKDYGPLKSYDIGFLGQFHDEDLYRQHGGTDMGNSFQNVRTRSIKMIQSMKDIEFFLPGVTLERKHCRHTKMFKGAAYAQALNQSKMWLCTTSALDVINPRFYECMGSRTLIFCNENPSYKGLFEPGKHCVTFKSDLSDLEEKLRYYLTHDQERQDIIDAADELFHTRHTWAHRADQVMATCLA